MTILSPASQAVFEPPSGSTKLSVMVTGSGSGSGPGSGLTGLHEASIAAGAHIVYLDTNNSTADFYERPKCSLRD